MAHCLSWQMGHTLLGNVSLHCSETLQKAGVDSREYNTHSFRIGAATTAKENDVSDVHIKMLGRWQSSAYQLYIRTPQEQLAKLSKQLVTSNE